MKKRIVPKASPNTSACLKCGHPVSIYFFSSVRDSMGKIVNPRCSNCGFYEDPE